ncbi:MAG TPA: acylneuraminate cytidylyltransferase family protein [Steroidobacteraceae bacterium]|jgi:CMP-N,N'-diacetyllegionaminic acid synthase|nr:acylneuraminate cytidylyltransferase family protein [Steroidobacteraceae bacterium]
MSDARVLGVITARGGSKGVPAKNIRTLAGEPLLFWTIQAARESRRIDRLILSSDDARIIRVARELGCEAPFVRPAELARDETPGVLPVLDALERVAGYDVVVLLQPTSPLRSASDIDACVGLVVSSDAPACVSVTAVQEHPLWMYWLQPGGQLQRVLPADPARETRRQDLPPVYRPNGAVYVARVPWLQETRAFLAGGTLGYVMPAERSLDIDTESDFVHAESALRQRVAP